MADLLENAAASLAGWRTRFMSRPVTYGRGSDSVSMQATVGKTVFEVDDGTGLVETFESRDYLVTAADLVLSGVTVKPQRGDQITDGNAVYEVMTPGKEDVFRFSDPYGVTLRIHTKLVECS